MRVCPVCRAELNDFESVCEYCGTEISLSDKNKALLENISFVLNSSNILINSNTANSKKIIETISWITDLIVSISDYSDFPKISELLKQLEKNKSLLEQKLLSVEHIERKNKVIITFLLSFVVEIVLFVIFLLVALYGKDKSESIIYGLLTTAGLIFGAYIFSNSTMLGGAIVGGFIGGIFSAIVSWLVISSIGQMILFLIFTISLVIVNIFSLRRK